MTTQKKGEHNSLDRLLVLSFIFISISFLDTLFALNVIALVLRLEQAHIYSNMWFIGFWAFLWGLPLAAVFKDEDVGATVGGDLLFLTGSAFIILMWQFLLALVAVGGGYVVRRWIGFETGFYITYIVYMLLILWIVIIAARE